MSKIKKGSRNSVLLIVVIMLFTIPNMPVYSAVGNYQSNSMALIANRNYDVSHATSEKTLWPAVLAVAAGVGLVVVAAFGVVEGWNSIHAESTLASIDFERNYSKYDFSKFDN